MVSLALDILFCDCNVLAENYLFKITKQNNICKTSFIINFFSQNALKFKNQSQRANNN